MSVAANIAFGLEMLGTSKPVVAARVAETLALVKLESFADRSPAQLSGGQQQRVALARALAPKPRVLLLDEPLSALDLKLRKQMQTELKRIHREAGISFVLVTHDQEEALAMSDRIAVMQRGDILQIGTPRDIYDNPTSRFVADFIGESNLLSGSVIGRGDITLSIRPEHVIVTAGNGGRAAGTVSGVTFLGLDTVYDIILRGGTTLRSRRRDAGALSTGDAVAVDWPDSAERELVN
jgi:spermidine/putrescine transport system ATP-binding protein